MTGLPATIADHVATFWPQSQPQQPAEAPGSIAIVTAFFDINRGDWSQLTSDVSSKYRRSVDDYFANFDHLARVRNDLIVFTSPDLAERVLAHRRAHGLEHRTTIFAVDRLFDIATVRAALAAADAQMTEKFKDFVWRPSAPEYNKADYVVVNALKSTFALTAIEKGAVRAAQLAWIDFGYAARDGIVETDHEWTCDFGDKINLFAIFRLDQRHIYDIVRRSEVYIQGCHIVGPVTSWQRFNELMSEAFRALIACGLIDDDQTMLLMAYRAEPDSFILRCRRIDPDLDWRFIFKRFRAGSLPPDEELPDVPDKGQPDWFRDLKTVLRRRLRASVRSLMSARQKA